jgi:hypothetical protein
MKVYKNAEKSTGPCHNCKKIVNTLYLRAPYRHTRINIYDVLQEFCTECGEVISIPHQSAKQLKKYREENHVGSNMGDIIKQWEKDFPNARKDIDKVKREKGKALKRRTR